VQLFQDIYDIVYFAVAGQVADLTLTPGSHNISVNLNNTILNSNCVSHYVVYWVHTLSENNNSTIVPCEEDSFLIEDLDACVEYEVSVEAVDEGNMSTVVNGTTRTETVGNYHTEIILLFL
jgi:hypothetical protein